MTNKFSDYLLMLASACITVLVLFGVYDAYGRYATLQQSLRLEDRGRPARELRATQEQKLGEGALPIADAMQRFASASRTTIPLIAPEASTDPAPAAGWMHHPDYQALQAEAPPEPPAPVEAPALDQAATLDDAAEELEPAAAEPEAAEDAPPAEVPAEVPAAAAAPTPPAAAQPQAQVREAAAQPAPAAP